MNSRLLKTFNSIYFIPAALLLLNFSIKIIYLSSGDISGDEPFTIFYSQVDFNTFSAMLKTENNPPFFFLLMHYWIKLFGISSFSARFMPLLFSTLTVLFIYKTGLKFFNLRIAIITSLLFTFSNFHIFFAHETRVDSLFTLLTTVSMYSFLSLVRDKNQRKHFILLILSNTLLVYSHFFGFFVILIQIVSLISIKEIRQSIFKKYSIISLITFVLYLPYIKLLILRFSSSSHGTWVPAPNLEGLYNTLWKFSNAPVNTVLFLLILLTSSAALIMRWNKTDILKTVYVKVTAIWFLMPFLLIFILSLHTPMFLDKYLIFVSIGYYFLIAVAINYLGKSDRIFYPVAAVSIFLMLITCNPKSGSNRNTKEMVNSITQLKTKNTVVYMCPEWIDLGFVYYFDINYFSDYKSTRSLLNKAKVFPINSAYQVNDSLISAAESAVYLDGWSEQVDKDHQIYETLHKEFRNVNCDESFHGFKIYHFTR